MKKILLLAVAAVMFVATPVMAKEGLYLGAGFVYNNILSDDLAFLDPAVGVELKVGVNLGSIAVEGNLIRSTHDDTDPGFGNADFTGVSVDLRISFSETHDPNQVYLLAGLGAYEIEENGASIDGTGLNLGVGVEHRFNEQVALDIKGVYRAIEYDEGGFTVDGDTFSVGAGLNLYF
jgi:hypothetical protein